MSKITIFISTPMNGKTREEIEERFDVIQNLVWDIIMFTPPKMKIERKDICFINSYDKENIPEKNSRVWCLGDSIKLMSQADVVIFDDAWSLAKGCVLEYEVCCSYGITKIEFNDSSDDIRTLSTYFKQLIAGKSPS